MKIEDQVTSLELSKKLKELGVKQESYFKWEERDGGYLELYHSKETSCAHKYYSSFTTSELLELLPKEWIRIEFHGKKYYCFYYFMEEEKLELEDILPNSLAKMLIYLIENNLLEIK